MINPGRFVRLLSTSRRMLSSKLDVSKPVSIGTSRKVYSEPVRVVTMDDLMEPYGPWKQAYAAENKRANMAVLRGALALTTAILIFINSGIVDGFYMPNLDNIMEETESFHTDKEDRVTV